MNTEIIRRILASVDASVEIQAMLGKIGGHLIDALYSDNNGNIYHVCLVHPNPQKWDFNIGLKDVDGIKIVPLVSYFDFDLTAKDNLDGVRKWKPTTVAHVLSLLNGPQRSKLRNSLDNLIKLHLPVKKPIEV